MAKSNPSEAIQTISSRPSWTPAADGRVWRSGDAARAASPLLCSIPHAGEEIPPEAPWLASLAETLLMFDVDRYVDRLYRQALTEMHIPTVVCPWHRYACDLNRFADDVDSGSVAGHVNPIGRFPRGLHWYITTTGEKLMPGPMTLEAHSAIVSRCFDPFHRQMEIEAQAIKARFGVVYHLDLHSMPSVGTKEHRDPGEPRADVVVSDCDEKSAERWWLDAVLAAFSGLGFKVSYNWPYKGGRITERYGQPARQHHTLQVELNRSLYMNEVTKQLVPEKAAALSRRLGLAIAQLVGNLQSRRA